MVTMSDSSQKYIELRFKDRLSVADAVVLEHHLGLTKAANFVAEVDPWCYPHDYSLSSIVVKSFVQSVVAQAANAARSLSQFTDASITEFLLSPLLIKKGDRPSFARKPHYTKGKSTPHARIVTTAAATVGRKPSSHVSILQSIKVVNPHFFTSPSPSLTNFLTLHVYI